MDLRFADHPSFQRAAAGMAGGAVLFGAALQPVTAWAPLVGGLIGVAAGGAIGYGRAGWRLIGAALAVAVLVVLPASWAVLTGAAAITALALAIGGPRGVRGLVGVVIGTLAVLVALWCALRIEQARMTAHWPALMRTAVASLAIGVVASLSVLTRHLALVRDPVRRAIQRLPAGLDAEIRALCMRAVKLWASARARGDDEAGRALVRDGVVKTLEVASKSAEVELAGPSESELAQRAADLDARIAAASDGEARAQYASARAAIADQQRYRAHLAQGRERLVARMHHHVAALEKYALAATGLGAARAVSSGAQLAELSHDVTASGDALAEVDLAA